eukprot:Opistho-2@19227
MGMAPKTLTCNLDECTYSSILLHALFHTHTLPPCFCLDDNRKCGPVFVFCNMGVSRSSTIVIAYMMRHKKWTLLESFEYLKSRRRGVCPNRGFQLQLSNLEELIFGEAKTDITGGLY